MYRLFAILACWWLLSAALSAQEHSRPPAPAAAPQLEQPHSVLKKAIVIPRTAAAAAAMVALDYKTIPQESWFQRRYIWLPTGSIEERVPAIIDLNSGPNLSSFDYNPPSTAGGALIPVDLSLLCDQEHLPRMIELWDSQSDDEPYFHDHVYSDVELEEPCEPYKAADGKVYDHRTVRSRQVVSIPARHLGKVGLDLESMIGNTHADTCSYCPIVRVDWFNFKSLTAADKGFYYRWRGLVPFDPKVPKSADKATKLINYLTSRGVDKVDIEKHDANNQEIVLSQVTERARGLALFSSNKVQPAVGRAIVVITSDNRWDKIDPREDAFLSLLNHRPDAFEVIAVLPNGWLEYTIWNGQGLLLVETDPAVVTDHTVPGAHQKRLQPAMSCIRCHGGTDGWQPFDNEWKAMMSDRGRTLSDLSRGTQPDEMLDQWRHIQARFNGDLMPVISDAQDSYDLHFHRVLGVGGKAGCEYVSNMTARYIYTRVNALTAAKEIGFVPGPTDPLGIQTFRSVVPPLEVHGFIPDHGFVSRLSTMFKDPNTAKLRGLELTRLQWEQIFGDVSVRSQPALEKASGNASGLGWPWN